MAYFKPYIDETGYHYPTYNEILEYLIDRMQTIYGSGIYLGNDSPDYEMLSTFAELTYDTYQSGEILYNAQSVETAMGIGLDYQAALVGISRKQPTKSAVTLTLTGVADTVITGGVCADANGYLWDLSGSVTIGDGGTATATAYCREYGFISAQPNTITRIMTPTLGWESVTNAEAVVAGTAVEKDSELRARFRMSAALSSTGMLDSLHSAILAIADVIRCVVYENDTHETNALGLPANSVCCVVEGGENMAVAETIWKKKGNGVLTYGGESGDTNLVQCTVYDQSNNAHTVSFARLAYVDISVEVDILPKNGYTEETSTKIQMAVANYLSGFGIGVDLDVSTLWSAVISVNENPQAPLFSVRSVKAARGSNTPGTADVQIAFNEVAHVSADDVVINVANS